MLVPYLKNQLIQMNLTDLRTFLDSTTIPVIKKVPKTFLEIARQPHYENVISNIYAFFFDVREEHGLNDLFIKSLVECINDFKLTGKDFSNFSVFDIDTEYQTKKKGRIDLLLYNDQQAIIIENKVYHRLNNDLDDYWNSVHFENQSVSSKIGIILSLKPISKDLYQQFEAKDEYINITHLQLMQRIKSKSEDYLINVDDNYRHLFQDFYQNIVNISRSTMDEKDIHFYIKNKEKINQLLSIKDQYKKHVIAEVERAGESIEGVRLVMPRNSFNSNRLRYYHSTKYNELVFTIVFEDLLSEKNILHIIIEPRGETLRNGEIFKNIEFNEKEREILQENFYSKTHEGWAHFAARSYELKTEDLATLSDFIQMTIVNDSFESVFWKMEKFLLKDNYLTSVNHSIQ